MVRLFLTVSKPSSNCLRKSLFSCSTSNSSPNIKRLVIQCTLKTDSWNVSRPSKREPSKPKHLYRILSALTSLSSVAFKMESWHSWLIKSLISRDLRWPLMKTSKQSKFHISSACISFKVTRLCMMCGWVLALTSLTTIYTVKCQDSNDLCFKNSIDWLSY